MNIFKKLKSIFGFGKKNEKVESVELSISEPAEKSEVVVEVSLQESVESTIEIIEVSLEEKVVEEKVDVEDSSEISLEKKVEEKVIESNELLLEHQHTEETSGKVKKIKKSDKQNGNAVKTTEKKKDSETVKKNKSSKDDVALEKTKAEKKKKK